MKIKKINNKETLKKRFEGLSLGFEEAWPYIYVCVCLNH